MQAAGGWRTRILVPLIMGVVLAAGGLAVRSSASVRSELRFGDRIVVKIRPGHTARGLDVIGSTPGLGIVTVRGSLSAIRSSPDVEYAEPDMLVPPAEFVPNDAMWADQWSVRKTRTDEAWSVTQGSPSIKIAVLDSGVDASQPDLTGNVLPGRNFYDDTSPTADDYGHGTMVAGVIAAHTDNTIGVAGYCSGCSILPVKIAGADGYASWSAMASGVKWAADQGARVINISFAGTTGSRAVHSAIKYAERRGAIVVASAGNYSSVTPTYPAAYRGVLAVASSESDDTAASYTDHGSWVRFAAPGCNDSTNVSASSPLFASFCGTSSAAPVVSAIAALAFSSKPNATRRQVVQAMTSGAVPVGYVSAGRIDAWGTLAALGR